MLNNNIIEIKQRDLVLYQDSILFTLSAKSLEDSIKRRESELGMNNAHIATGEDLCLRPFEVLADWQMNQVSAYVLPRVLPRDAHCGTRQQVFRIR